MLSASTEFIRAMQDNHTFKVKIDCTLMDGTQLTIDNSNIRMDSLSFEKAISDDASFDIGSFIVGKLSFTLNNIPGTYNGMDFDGAVLVLSFANQLNGKLYPASNLYPGTNLYPGQISSQYVRIGTYTVVDTDGQNGAWISLVAYDNAYKFQVPLSSINMTFPMTASSLVSTICNVTGVTCASRPASLNSITIQALPDGVEPNCLQALAWCAMMAGRNASIDAYGRLYFPSYPKATLASVQADIETNGWDNADLSAVNEITGPVNVRTMVEDVTITGVAVTYTNTDGEEATTAVSGTEGYVLNLAENAFVNENNVSAVVSNLNSAVVGMTFRPFEITMMGNPLFEPGDIVWFENRKGQKFLSVLTSMSFTLGEHMTALCGAEAPEKQSAMDYSANTRVIQQTKAIARRAVKIAGNTNQYFWHTETGTDTGAHITEVTQEEFLADPANGGGNLLARSNGIAVRDGLTELATFSADGVVVGGLGQSKSSFSATKMDMLSNVGVPTFTIDQAGTQEETWINKTINDTQKITGIQPNSYNLWTWSDAVAGGKVGGSLAVSIVIATSAYSRVEYLNDTFTIGTAGTSVHNVTAQHLTCRIEVSYGTSGAISIKASKPSDSGAYWMILRSVHYDAYIAMPVYSIGKRVDGTQAQGPYSTIIGEELIGSGPRQTVIGKYNVEDTNGDYAFIIGNGSSSSARSNAFAVTWDGDVVLGKSPITTVDGTSTSLANNTVATIAEVTLDKGIYLLTGSCRYSANTHGYRTLLFARNGATYNAADRYAVMRVGAAQSNTTYLQVTWPVEITADDTTIYLNALQDSGSTLTADSNGIKVVRLG